MRFELSEAVPGKNMHVLERSPNKILATKPSWKNTTPMCALVHQEQRMLRETISWMDATELIVTKYLD